MSLIKILLCTEHTELHKQENILPFPYLVDSLCRIHSFYILLRYSCFHLHSACLHASMGSNWLLQSFLVSSSLATRRLERIMMTPSLLESLSHGKLLVITDIDIYAFHQAIELSQTKKQSSEFVNAHELSINHTQFHCRLFSLFPLLFLHIVTIYAHGLRVL